VESPRRTWFDERGLVIAAPQNGGAVRRVPFYAGALHYWRVPQIRWGASLRAMHGLGLTCVETPVPWRVHEPDAGSLLWTGARDLGRFLDAARAAGLAVVLRLGPHANADLTSMGLPDWVLAEPDVQARTSHGTVAWMPQPPRAFPIPSFASSAFHARVKSWYAALADVIRPHLAPDGPVTAIALDTDAPLFFRTGAFDLDYHPDALAWWREASGLDAPPLEYAASDAARCALWLKFKDEYQGRALRTFGALLDDAGLGGIARVDSLVAPRHALHGSALVEPALLHRHALACASNAAPVPVAIEAAVGASPWFPPVAGADTVAYDRDRLLVMLAAGVRGFDLAMAVERDRHLGAAISTQGKVATAWLQPLLAALAETEWTSLHRHPRPTVALVDTRADARFGTLTNLVDPVTPVLADLLQLGPAGSAELGTDAAAIAARRWQSAIVRALELAQVSYAILDEATPESALASYRAVIAPTHERIDRGLFERLRALAEHKRAVVVIGPGTPARDELDQPHTDSLPRRVGKLQASSLDDEAGLRGLADDLLGLAGDLPDAWQVERPDDVRAYAFADSSDRVRVVFVISSATRAVSAVLLAEGTSLRDPLSAETVPVVDGRATIALVARGVRMFVVETTTR